MDVFLWIAAGVLLMGGVLGSILPVLPGLPLSWLGLLLVKWTDTGATELSWNVLIWTGILTVVVSILDQFMPVWGTRKMGGSRWVVRGAGIGLLFGFFMGPVGIVLGPFLGALLAALFEGQRVSASFLQATGAFIGILVGTVFKLMVGGILIWFYFSVLLAL
ncbi:MAG: DUF456 domain-containing protein [Bacteroidales bacterium]